MNARSRICIAKTSSRAQPLLALWVVLLTLAGMGAPAAAQGQSAEASDEGTAYFHRAAQHYLAGDEEAARDATEAGLDVAPTHPKLQALREQLETLPPDPSADDQGAEGEGTDEGESDASPSSPPGNSDASNLESDTSEEDASPQQPDNAGGEQAPPGDASADTSGTPEASGTGAEEPESDAPEPDLPQPSEPPAPEDPNGGEGEQPTEAEMSPSSSAPPSASSQLGPRLTREQAEQLLQLVEAHDQPLMRAMRSFGAEQAAGPDW